MESRISYFERMLERDPENPTGLLALANEYEKARRPEDVVRVLRRYIASHEDEGNAYARLGEALVEFGREEEAKEVYRRGIERALAHEHGELAGEMRLALEQLE
ncbi:hypothetical protein E0L93_10925 [Rubrobacter taiwanensis]|uniref:Uncharacterized protein n=1 Tax=Rubrobacter taiwanensis TaxID=185139 RepID=A0A4R1BGA2_9ACTN|nr:hypothetical protein [Rubrobacter taiwanensis]TCJ16177.1 hypothetical protein E0L93_10925 [Rubrobacter taiwanensis]